MKEPLAGAATLLVSDFLSWVWTKSPRAALVELTKDLNCSNALACAAPAKARLRASAPMVVLKIVCIIAFLSTYADRLTVERAIWCTVVLADAGTHSAAAAFQIGIRPEVLWVPAFARTMFYW